MGYQGSCLIKSNNHKSILSATAKSYNVKQTNVSRCDARKTLEPDLVEACN